MNNYSDKGMGFIYFEQGQIDKAMDEFSQILELDFKNEHAHFGLGLCYYEKGEFDKALEEFGQVLRINPLHGKATYSLGLCYDKKREFSQASEYYKQAIVLDPQNKYVYCQLGQVYLEQKQYDLALEAFKKAAEINPKMPSVHQGLGAIYFERNLYSLAEAEFQQTVLLDSDNIFARQMLGYIYRKQGKDDLAVNEFIKTTDLCLKNGKINKEHIGFKVKIFRMPDFSSEIKGCPAGLRYTLLPPLALGQIVAYLKENAVDIDQDDLNIKIHYDNHYSRMPESRVDATVFFDENRILRYVLGSEDRELESIIEDIAKKSKFHGYDVILLSLREVYSNSSCLMFTLSLSRFLKKKYNPILILGGSGQSIDLLRKYNCKDIDYIIYGEGEVVLLKLLLALKDKMELSNFLNSQTNTESKFISIKLTDVHPPLKPDFSGLPIDKYRYLGFDLHYNGRSCDILEEFSRSGTLLLPFKFIKGCPYECIFCTMSGNRSMLVLDPLTTALHLKKLQEEYNPTGFFFLSDTINISRQYVNELCDKIIENKIKVLWSDCARADNLDRDMLFKMRKAGCIRLIFGMETASSRLLKYTDKRIALTRLENILKWSDEAGIWTGVEVICGLPHEKDSDIEETIVFLNKNKRYINTLYINQFDLRDGSILLKKAEKFEIENIVELNQYANEEFTYFHKYGYDEIGGLCWQDKRMQIINSYKKLLKDTEGNSFFTYELEHLLFFLYNKSGNKQKVCDMYSEIELKTRKFKGSGAAR